MDTTKLDTAGDPAAAVTQDDKNFAMIAHFGQIVTSFVAPLVVYLMKKDQSKYVAFHALQGIFFSLGVLVLFTGVTVVTFGIGSFLSPLFWVGQMVFNIIAGIKVSSGEMYEYPLVGEMARKQIFR